MTRVAIVTPTLDMAGFLGDAIDSVLAQDHPEIDYVVMDGGSTDATLELLVAYGDRVRWYSERDGGQADAINKGLARAEGEVVAFLNADDVYRPGAVAEAVAALERHPDAAFVYGDGLQVDDAGAPIGPYPTADFDLDALMHRSLVCQPAAFVRRSALEAVGGIDPSLRYALDYDLWIRLGLRFPAVHVSRTWAATRLHAAAKTMAAPRASHREAIAVVKRHYGYVPVDWALGYARALTQPADPLVAPRRTVRTGLVTLAVGLRHNPRHPLRFAREWLTAVRGR